MNAAAHINVNPALLHTAGPSIVGLLDAGCCTILTGCTRPAISQLRSLAEFIVHVLPNDDRAMPKLCNPSEGGRCMRDEPSVSESEDAPAMPAGERASGGLIITSDRHAENNMKAAGARMASQSPSSSSSSSSSYLHNWSPLLYSGRNRECEERKKRSAQRVHRG